MEAVLGPDAAAVDPLIRPTQDPRFGDYQSNCAMPLAKKLGRPPREVAQDIVASLQLDDICEPPTIAGPGFVNLTLSSDFLARSLESVQTDERLGLPSVTKPKRVVVDYSGINVAKLMHVGHMRSTIVGDCVVRLLEFAGHEVIRRNHIGDWGLQMGMVVHATANMLQELEDQYGTDADGEAAATKVLAGRLEQIEQHYKNVSDVFGRDSEIEEACREQLRRLQNHDQQAYRRWSWVRSATLQAGQANYDRLGAKLCYEDVQGESAYTEDFEPMLAELEAAGKARDDAGALCIFLRDDKGEPLFRAKDGSELPLLIRKRDGTYLYSTFDLAGLRYRGRVFKADRIVYVHDARQKQHFAMVFEAARQAGYIKSHVRLDFIPFGTVMGKDRRPFKTRSGQPVLLHELLDEAESRAREVVDANSPEWPEEQRAEIAKRVGIGAVKYNDLIHNIASDYVFSWDKMLAMDGNTAPYMMYAYARVQSIGRKGGVDYNQLDPNTRISLDHPAERALAKKLLQFGEVFEWACGSESDSPAPQLLTTYLFETSQAFSGFYKNCPVLKAPSAQLKSSRLRLCDLTARTLKTGLGFLGIQTVERM
jgi:arginyl-tRNA synthetase